MAAVLKKVLIYSAEVILKYGKKVLTALVSYIKANWKTVAKWIAEWGVWEAIEYIVHLLGF